MTNSTAFPGVQDLASVGTRISWGAILAGTMVALGIYFLLSTLAAAIGLSINDRLDPTKLETGAIVWAIVTTASALFFGGVVTSLFTAGENKGEAMLYGVIMWAVMVVMVLHLGSVGVRTGITAMTASVNTVRITPPENAGNVAVDAETRQQALAAATRVAWYAFFGTWMSMFAAVGGALVGAGPTFRIVGLTARNRSDMNRPRNEMAGAAR